MLDTYNAERGQNREIILTPKSNEIEYSLIWLHGLGDSAEGFLPIFMSDLTPVPETFKVRLLTAPASPVTINNGMICNSWYDILALDRSENSLNYEDVKNNSAYVQKIIQEEVDLFKGDTSRVIIGGFSQGCAMALHNGLVTDVGQLGAIVGLSGYLFPKTVLKDENPPILLSHGEEDPMIQIDYAEETYKREDFLKRKNVQFHRVELLDHGINVNVLKLVRTFIKGIIKK